MCEVCQAFSDQAMAAGEMPQSVVIPSNSPVDSLFSGTQRTDTNISVHFAGLGQGPTVFENTPSEGWTAYERARVEAALTAISNVANVTFTVTSNPDADFQLIKSAAAFNSPNSLGYFYLPNGTGRSPGVFNSDGIGWTNDGLREGGTGYAAVVHELLHGLGLGHTHDGINVMDGVTQPFNDFGRNNLNQGIYSTMSYNSGLNGTDNANRGAEAGPMALDIAALQAIYGANMSHATGDDVYDLDTTNSDGAAWKSIWDAGGTDTIRYNGSADTTIDLREATLEYKTGGGGFISSANNVSGGFTIANGAIIEYAIGGRGDDNIIGNGVNNELSGRGGDDDIRGNEGDDTINGNSGSDDLSATSGTNLIYGGSGFDDIDGGSGRDTVYGGGGNDTIDGNNGNDFLFGGRGNDTINGGGNNDQIVGGMGADDLRGGNGEDDFIFEFVSDSFAGAGNRDIIRDFQVGEDDIDLSAIGGLNFSDDIDLNVSGGNTVVAIDVNGDGSADMEIFVTGVTNLGENDFIL